MVLQAVAGVVQHAVQAASRPQPGAQLTGAALSHERVQVEVPAVEPVRLVLGGRERGVGPRLALVLLALELVDAPAQRVELAAGRLGGLHGHGQRFSAMRGVSRMKTHRPSAKIAATIATGTTISSSPPIAVPAVGA